MSGASSTPRPFRFGLTVKRADTVREWRALARKAEGLGYSTLFVGDHIRDQWGPLVGLTVAAEATSTLHLGTNVLNNDLRNPIVLAQELATLDVVSTGRVEFGVGAGYSPVDYRATGIPLDPAGVRIERLQEAIQVMKLFWRDGRVDFRGKHFEIEGAVGQPRPFSTPWPRVCIGGGGPRVLRLAGEEADIVSLSPSLAEGAMGAAAMAGAGPARFLERVQWVQEAAGDRFSEIELHISVLFGGIEGKAPQARATLAKEFGLGDDDVSSLPIALVGSVDEVCEKVLAMREQYGITYFSVADAEGFAPVVARLAGRPVTVDNVVSSIKKPARSAVRSVRQRLRGAPPPVVEEEARKQNRVLMVGAGGMGEIWLRKYVSRFEHRCRIVGLVDVAPGPLQQQGDTLGVPADHRFSSMDAAFAAVRSGSLGEVDACFVVIPPDFHRHAVEGAAESGLDVLCEKPMAGTWDDCVATARAVRQAGVKLQIVQNYRYLPHIQAAKAALQSAVVGPLNYLVCRFGSDYRIRNSWGAPFRHEIDHPMLLEGAAHHLDQARHLAGSDLVEIYADDWRPATASGFDGSCSTFVVGRFRSGARLSYEGSAVAAGGQSTWNEELYRMECADGAIVVTGRDVSIVRKGHRGDRVDSVPVPGMKRTGHGAVLEQFFDWLDHDREPETTVDDNLATAAALFAAIRSAAEGAVVDVDQMLAAAHG